MSETPDVSTTWSRDRHRVEPAAGRRAVAKREVVFGIDDLGVSYGTNLAVKGVSLDDLQEPDHRR